MASQSSSTHPMSWRLNWIVADSIVCDTSVWLYLGRISQVEVLNSLYERVYTTTIVCNELQVGRFRRPDTIDPAAIPWVQIVEPTKEQIASLPPNQLGPGEQSVIASAASGEAAVAGLDDQPARLLALEMGLGIVGTIGLLIRSKDAGLIAEVRPHLGRLLTEGFYIHPSLMTAALRMAGE